MPGKLLTINDIPAIGFGTYPLTGKQGQAAIEMAIAAGFRHIDTAQLYGNEATVGAAIAASGLRRGEVFVTTKVNGGNIARDRFLPSIRKSLEDLRLSQVDLLLIHWPPASAAIDAAIDELNLAADCGLAARIGISNFPVAYMRRAAAHSRRKLAINQVEFHPLLDQSKLKKAADELGITLSAYCPLARGVALSNPAVQAVASRLGENPASIVLAWILQQGVIALPMTTKPANAKANLRALEINLTLQDMAAISKLTETNRRLVSPGDMAALWDR